MFAANQMLHPEFQLVEDERYTLVAFYTPENDSAELRVDLVDALLLRGIKGEIYFGQWVNSTMGTKYCLIVELVPDTEGVCVADVLVDCGDNGVESAGLWISDEEGVETIDAADEVEKEIKANVQKALDAIKKVVEDVGEIAKTTLIGIGVAVAVAALVALAILKG